MGAVKHAPGEWVAVLDTGNPSGSQWGVRVPNSFWLCDCLDNGGPVRGASYGEANARLMAAAPDLLAALVALDEAFCSNNDTRDERRQSRLALIAARAAVAKATGAAS